MGAFQQLQSLGVLLFQLVHTEVVSRPEITVGCACRNKTSVDRANMRSGNEQLSDVALARLNVELVSLLPGFIGFDWTGLRKIGGFVMLQAMQRCRRVHALGAVNLRRARHAEIADLNIDGYRTSRRLLASYWLTS